VKNPVVIDPLAAAKRRLRKRLTSSKMEGDGYCLIDTGGTPIGLLGPAKDAGDRFDPFRVGVDHVALSVTDIATLTRIK